MTPTPTPAAGLTGTLPESGLAPACTLPAIPCHRKKQD